MTDLPPPSFSRFCSLKLDGDGKDSPTFSLQLSNIYHYKQVSGAFKTPLFVTYSYNSFSEETLPWYATNYVSVFLNNGTTRLRSKFFLLNGLSSLDRGTIFCDFPVFFPWWSIEYRNFFFTILRTLVSSIACLQSLSSHSSEDYNDIKYDRELVSN